MTAAEKIKEILARHLNTVYLGRYLVVDEENPIASRMPTGVPLKVVGEGMGSKHITYNAVEGWDEIGEDDRYIILQDSCRKNQGYKDGEINCYALKHDHQFKVMSFADDYLIERITDDIEYEIGTMWDNGSF